MITRSNEKELLDLGPSHYTQDEYEDCLRQLGRIGHFLGGDQATFQTFSKISPPKTILDIGCGGGQFALALAEKFPEAHVVGVDISSAAIAFAQQRLAETSLKNIRFDVTDATPFPTDSFDVVTATLVCHHLNDHELVHFLKDAYNTAKKAVILNDLHRHWLAYTSFSFIARIFFRNRLISHDGLLSIRRSFTRQDWIHALEAAEIPLDRCSITWHWAFRWTVLIDTSTKRPS